MNFLADWIPLAPLKDEEIYGTGITIKEELNEDVTKETYLDIKEDPFDYTDEGRDEGSKVKVDLQELRHEANENDLCILIQDSTDVDDICYKKVHPINFNDKSYRYQICNKTFTCGISRHMKSHTKKKPYKCKNCNKTFPGNRHLMDHIRVHTEEKPYNSKICIKTNRTKTVQSHKNTYKIEAI
ncbi:zinc finger protein 611-like [Penaeus monodon]|uniref:zinc finger protein 611-like n=1 Tax=Penaeus monodon TaxID=6687 RepID=UPI0018A6ED6C|nr:zinc finger protein 611-like [Penaeus monodon]